jgi:hypothetical protein
LASRERGQGQALSWGRSLPSPARTLVTPYCKRTRPGRGTNTKAAGSPSLSLSLDPAPATDLALSLPLRARPRARPIWAGARGTLTRRLGDPPVSKRRQVWVRPTGQISCPNPYPTGRISDGYPNPRVKLPSLIIIIPKAVSNVSGRIPIQRSTFNESCNARRPPDGRSTSQIAIGRSGIHQLILATRARSNGAPTFPHTTGQDGGAATPA